MYTRFPWMAKRRKVIDDVHQKNYKPSYYGFNKKIADLKTQVWTSDEKEEKNSFIQCIYFALQGKMHPKIEGIPNENTKYLSNLEKEEICNKLNLIVDIYIEENIEGGRKIAHHLRLGDRNNNRKIAILRSSKHPCYYLYFIPHFETNKIPIINEKVYCNTCGNWRTTECWNLHISGPNRCCKCECGKTYKYQDGHYEQCNKKHFKENYSLIEEPRRYKPMKPSKKNSFKNDTTKEQELIFNNIFFADFETFVDKVKGDTAYTVYAGAWVSSNISSEENHFMFYGKESLNDFMKSLIENCSGIIWFFNGSRFDNFFILEWILENKIQYDESSILMTSSTLLSIKFKTRKGWLQIKDLAKFLDGSLAENCKSFGLKKDESKTDFDHLKMKSWENVYEFKEEVEEYLKMDIYSLRSVYMRFANAMFGLYKLDVAKFMTIGHISYAAWTTTLPENIKIYKTKSGRNEEVMRKLYKGGRVICGRKMWKSKSFDSVISSAIPFKRDLNEEEINELKKKDLEPIDYLHQISKEKIDGDYISQQLYDSINDVVIYVDANSLYPSVQVDRKYPVGKHVFYSIEAGTVQEKKLINEYNGRNKEIKKLWMKRAFLVDLICPKNLSIAFLITKNPKTGGVQQNLLDKNQEWYTGPELWEAKKLGYQIIRIWEYIEWEDCREIFNDFVKPTYAVKCACKKDDPRYNTTKKSLNATTGKYGQKNITEQLKIFGENTLIEKDLYKISEINDKNGNFLAFYGYERKNFSHSPYPIELSAFILAHSRIYMSKMLRRMNIHNTNYHESPIYGDTDSIIIPISAWNRLPEKYKGDKILGQFKNELPNSKVIAVFVLAPKTYCIIYVLGYVWDDKTKKLVYSGKIMCIIKSKGIPHPKDSCNALEKHSVLKQSSFEKYMEMKESMEILIDRDDIQEIPKDLMDKYKRYKSQVELFNSVLEEQHFLNQRSQNHTTRTVFHENVDIKRRSYVIYNTETNELIDVCKRIPALFIEKVLTNEYTIVCLFGTMNRKIKPGDLKNICITPDSKIRIYNKNDWWNQVDKTTGLKHREYSILDKDELYPTSYPIGHEKLQ